MPNPFYRQQQTQMNPMMNMMNQFNRFKQMFTGDPRQMVMGMLQNGQMSKTQFEQLSEMARQFQGMMRR